MNKLLFSKVKDQCKDTGLSEECLKALTEAIGGSIEDDSTDEEAIGKVANQIKQVAVSTQSEAARWANNKKDPKNKKDQKKQKPANKDGEGDDDDPDRDQDQPQKTDNQVLELLKKLEKRMDQFEVDGKTKDRQKLIKEAMENHKIPAKFRDRLAKSIGMMRILRKPSRLSNRISLLRDLLLRENRKTRQQRNSKWMKLLMPCSKVSLLNKKGYYERNKSIFRRFKTDFYRLSYYRAWWLQSG